MNLLSLGWWGYFACAVVYVVGGLRAGDAFSVIGSLFFLGATAAFIIHHYRYVRAHETREQQQ